MSGLKRKNTENLKVHASNKLFLLERECSRRVNAKVTLNVTILRT